MPSYTDLARLTARYGAAMLLRATDRAEDATGTIDAAVVQKACDDATALIDGYLAARYALPLVTVPPLIAAVAEDVAIWRLHPYETDPKLRADYEAALRTLRDIGTGIIRLPAPGLDLPGTGGTGAQYTDRERPLTADNLKGFI